jgi:molybdenum cofactor guanylyltransferase
VSSEVTLALLAGGQSLRFGGDKALAQLQGRPLLSYPLARLAGVGVETLIVTNRPAAYAQFNQRLVGDLLPGCGVLGGLYTALHYAAGPWVLCLACDMPLVNRSLVEYMLTLRAGVDAVLPRLNGQAEPLHALWARTCLEPIRAALERGDRRVISFLPAVRVRYVSEAEIDSIDPEHLSFLNVNTPDQLADIAQRLRE